MEAPKARKANEHKTRGSEEQKASSSAANRQVGLSIKQKRKTCESEIAWSSEMLASCLGCLAPTPQLL